MPSLHHLIKPTQAAALLSEFAALAPGCGLALLRPDGSTFAAADRTDQASAETGALYQPISVAGETIAHLAVRPAAAWILPPLAQSLALLLQDALEKREIARETLDRYREINLLYHTAETIGACLDPDEIPLLTLTESARVIPADARLVLLRQAEGTGELELKAASQAEELLASATQLVEDVLHTGRPDIRAPASARESGPSARFSSLLCAPLKARDRALGVVLLGRVNQPSKDAAVETRPEDEPAAQFTAGEQKLLMALATQAGIAIEKAWMHRQELRRQQMEQELAIGRRIQHSLLPQALPRLAGWEFAVYYQAAREVGGDFYDFFETNRQPLPASQEDGSNPELGIFIADITGKGVPAALMMAFSRAMLRTLLRASPHIIASPVEVLKRLNALLIRDNRTGLLLTALYAALDPASGRVSFTNAGHERPLWVRAAGECLELVSSGALLGAFPNILLEERQVDLVPGDLLIFYTDGVTEARNQAGELFGEGRLQEILQVCRGNNQASASAEATAQAILHAIQTFSAGAPPADDITIVVIRRMED